ncbi:MAG: glycosyltransferase family 2 protein [Terriglobales bacterium]
MSEVRLQEVAPMSATDPMVSFVVPCHKLAHWLPDCVASILSQTCRDFEVLIMDDCSPDNTSEVARSFQDPRVRYIRNETNLGHLRNYNKGIGLARGRYVWLISADDRLRRDYALERYLRVMEAHPRVGYAFCAGIGLKDERETSLLQSCYYGERDRIFDGRVFISRLLDARGILSPSVLARKECYEKVSIFPLDLPHQGDMYLWCRWALRYDVAYFAEPMVNYRLHDTSMMSAFKRESPEVMVRDELEVLWNTKWEAIALGYRHLADLCDRFIAAKYAHYIVSGMFQDKRVSCVLTLAECEDSLRRFARNERERKRVRARVFAGVGDEHYWHRDRKRAIDFYKRALSEDPWMGKIWLKRLLLQSGGIGAGLRESAFALRRLVKH